MIRKIGAVAVIVAAIAATPFVVAWALASGNGR